MDFHLAESGTTSLPVLVGLPAAVLLAAIFTFALARSIKRFRAESKNDPYSHRFEWGWAVALTATWLAGTILVTAFGMYPYSAEYHQFRNASGTVSAIDSRLNNTSSGMEDKFVIRFEGSDMQFGCDDTRCAQVSEGDALTLSCKRVWQYTGTDGYDCRFVETKAATR